MYPIEKLDTGNIYTAALSVLALPRGRESGPIKIASTKYYGSEPFWTEPL